MVAQDKIVMNIDNSRNNITDIIDKLSFFTNKKIDIYSLIKENPLAVSLVVFIIGVTIAVFSKRVSLKLFAFAAGLLRAAVFGYLSKHGVAYLLKKIK